MGVSVDAAVRAVSVPYQRRPLNSRLAGRGVTATRRSRQVVSRWMTSLLLYVGGKVMPL
jgi:hypothetical protein